MAKCFSFTESRDWCYRYSFSHSGLKSSTVDLGGGTIMHSWVPKTHKNTKPNLCLLHGIGANAMWQWSDFITPLISKFNVYVPDLLFFGDSYTTRPERSESFQAQCVMGLLEAHGVQRVTVVGLSYGGFVAYSMAAQYKEKVESTVLICAGVTLEEKDMDDGLFKVKSVDDAGEILFPQRPEKMKELLKLTFYKPPKNIPSCFFKDFIHPTLIIWGEYDQVFPLELAHRLKRHLGENAELKVIKKAGHAVNVEKPKEMHKLMKSFLFGRLPGRLPTSKQENNSNGHKVD